MLDFPPMHGRASKTKERIDVRFEPDRWQVWYIGLSYLAVCLGEAFDLASLRVVGLGALGTQLLIVFLWDRR